MIPIATARAAAFAALAILPLAVILAAPAAQAEPLPRPEGEVLLTVSGAIAHTNDGDTARFDRAMLEAMEPVTIETTTIWTEGTQSFTGVPLSRLMEEVGAGGATLTATAINDYAVEIPGDDKGAIIAYLNNGKAMSVRDKGPLWVIYPYDSSPDYRTEVIYSRSIWQLDRISVEE